MSQLEKAQDKKLNKQVDNRSLLERFKAKRTDGCLLIDISGSMSSDCEPGCSKINAVREIVKGIAGDPVMLAFEYRVHKIKNKKIPDPMGGTMLAPALKAVKDRGFKSCIIITDGEVYDKEASLAEIQDLEIKVMYVGPGPKPEFLDDLANRSGGFCTLEDLSKRKELTDKVQFLLGSGEPEKDRTIKL
jgi:hypothetical protein